MDFSHSNIELMREVNGNAGWSPDATGGARRLVDSTNHASEHAALGVVDTSNLLSSIAAISVPFVVKQSGIPLGIPAGNGSTTGLMFTDAAGAFTLTTAIFPMIYSSGIWLWVPVNGFTASTPAAAGFYWATTSTTAQGVLTGVTFASTGGVTPTAAQITAAPAVTTENRWFTQQTTVVAAVVTATIPAGTIGPSGQVRTDLLVSHRNSAGAKTTALKLGSNAVLTVAPTTTAAGRYNSLIMNRTELKQICPANTAAAAYGESVGVATGHVFISTDTTADVAVTVDMTIAVNTDYMILEGYSVSVTPGA